MMQKPRYEATHRLVRDRRWVVPVSIAIVAVGLVSWLGVANSGGPGLPLGDAAIAQPSVAGLPYVPPSVVADGQQASLPATAHVLTSPVVPLPRAVHLATASAKLAAAPVHRAAVTRPAYTPPAPAPTHTYTPPPTATPVPEPTQPPPTPSTSQPGSSLGARVLAEAETREGDPYVYGAAGPTSFDCSGLVYWAAQQLGITGMPRDTFEMLSEGVSNGTLVPVSNPVPGDLAFFGTGHVEFVTSIPDTTFGAQHTGTLVGFNKYYPPSYEPTAYFAIV